MVLPSYRPCRPCPALPVGPPTTQKKKEIPQKRRVCLRWTRTFHERHLGATPRTHIAKSLNNMVLCGCPIAPRFFRPSCNETKGPNFDQKNDHPKKRKQKVRLRHCHICSHTIYLYFHTTFLYSLEIFVYVLGCS